MDYFKINSQNPQKKYIQRAVEVLKKGGVIIYPTDTVYGIGCDIFNKKGLDKIFEIKRGSENKLFSFVCENLKDIAKYAKVSDQAYRVMKHLLPGPYTFILPAARLVPKKLWSKRKTVGIRVPAHKVAIELSHELGNPIISTSVTNRKGEILFDSNGIKSLFSTTVDLMLLSDSLIGEPSSVIDLSNEEPEIIREGAGDISLFIA